MSNPFENRTLQVGGPATDIAPVTPDDNTDLAHFAVALYAETGGSISFVTVQGQTRQVAVSDFSILPVGIRRVLATGTSALGIHAFIMP